MMACHAPHGKAAAPHRRATSSLAVSRFAHNRAIATSATILCRMRIEWRDQRRKRIGRVEVDPVTCPTRAPIIERGIHTPEREAFLQWEGALDDAGQLRKCIACGCGDLFKEKAFPQVTGLVIVLAFVGAIIGALGLATNLPVLLLLIVVLILDVAILLFSNRRLVCYRCRSSHHNVPIARYHRSWDRSVADRYPLETTSAEDGRATTGAAPPSDPPAREAAVLASPLPPGPGDLATANAGDVMDTKSYFQ
jgi:hypothetical protein